MSRESRRDYHYECAARDVKPAPIVFTFSVCGSLKTLEFVQWLGVDVPHSIENELRHAEDTLDASYDQAVATAVELIAFCRRVEAHLGSASRASRSAKSRSRPPSASPPGYKQSYVASPESVANTAVLSLSNRFKRQCAGLTAEPLIDLRHANCGLFCRSNY